MEKLKCTSCGGNLEVEENKEYAVCSHCGAKYKLNKDLNVNIRLDENMKDIVNKGVEVQDKFVKPTAIEIVVIITLIVVLIGSILLTYNKTNTLKYSYYLIGIGAFSVILYIINKILNFKFSKLEIAIIVLAVLTLFSLIGTIDYKIALWGRPNRREGLYVILTYYALALITSNIKSKKQIKIIIGSILTVGFSNIIYGLMQT